MQTDHRILTVLFALVTVTFASVVLLRSPIAPSLVQGFQSIFGGLSDHVPEAKAPPFPNTAIPGAGYRAGGWDTCGSCFEEGDSVLNIDLLARVCEYTVPGLSAPDGGPFRFVLRTWVNGSNDGGACGESPLGPTMVMQPGQRVNILIRNNISQNGWLSDGPLGPRLVNTSDYLYYVQDFGRYEGMTRCSAGPLRMYGIAPPCGPGSNQSSPIPMEQCRPNGMPNDGFSAVNWHDMPGSQEGGFDSVNLHLHGLEVYPHLFHPQGTSDPRAKMIRTLPPNHPDHKEKGCYCYKFDIPHDHKDGSFWYHIHGHGSTAMQAWSGMMGLLKVHSTRSGHKAELESYGASRRIDFPIWDPHFEPRTSDRITKGVVHTAPSGSAPRAHRAYTTDKFLKGQTDASQVVFLVGGESQPTFDVGAPFEPIWLQVLCATTENLVSMEILDAEDKPVPGALWHVASDSLAFDRPYCKEFLVMASGHREEVVLQLPNPGLYRVVMQRCEFIQFFCTGSSNTTLARLHVTASTPQPPEVPLEEWRFNSNAYFSSISEKDIRAKKTITFDVVANREVVPFPTMQVNGNSYNVERIDEWMKIGDAEEWVLMNPDNTWHPFHMHVTPFMVVETRSSWPYSENFTDIFGTWQTPKGIAVHAFIEGDPPLGRWRDTAFLPPRSVTRIWVRFTRPNLVGKTLGHCHFQAHSDTGMMSNIMLLPQDWPCNTTNEYRQPWMPGWSCYGYPEILNEHHHFEI